MKLYDYIFLYFYKYFKNRGDANPENLAIPLVTLLVGSHIILLIVIVNFIIGYNFLVEDFGVKTDQGKYYSLPIVVAFLVGMHILLKRRFNWLQTHRVELSDFRTFGISPTKLVLMVFILSITLIIIFMKL
jgi:amino acid permease